MKKLQWHRYRMLELIPDQPPISSISSHRRVRSAKSWLQALWQMIDVALLRDLEPRVWQSTDPRTRQIHWHLYDPETGKTKHLNSEAEIRQWLEKILRF